MSADGISKRTDVLTEGEKRCLRLVYKLLNSKQIAAELNLSRHTVDNRLRRALAKLGTSSRTDAARLLIELEGEIPQTNVWSDQSLVLSEDEETGCPDLPNGKEIAAHAKDDNAPSDIPGLPGNRKPSPQDGVVIWFGTLSGPFATLLGGCLRKLPRFGALRTGGNGAERGVEQDPQVLGREARQHGLPRAHDARRQRGWVSNEAVASSGNGHDLSALTKVGVVLASAVSLVLLMSATLSSLNALTELCASAKVCQRSHVIHSHNTQHPETYRNLKHEQD